MIGSDAQSGVRASRRPYALKPRAHLFVHSSQIRAVWPQTYLIVSISCDKSASLLSIEQQYLQVEDEACSVEKTRQWKELDGLER